MSVPTSLSTGSERDAEKPILISLSPRESEILLLLSKGNTSEEMADALFISKRTVRTHVSAILGKLHSNSRLDAILTAQAQGLIQSPREIEIDESFLNDMLETERAIRKLMRHMETQIDNLLKSQGR